MQATAKKIWVQGSPAAIFTPLESLKMPENGGGELVERLVMRSGLESRAKSA